MKGLSDVNSEIFFRVSVTSHKNRLAKTVLMRGYTISLLEN